MLKMGKHNCLLHFKFDAIYFRICKSLSRNTVNQLVSLLGARRFFFCFDNTTGLLIDCTGGDFVPQGIRSPEGNHKLLFFSALEAILKPAEVVGKYR